MKMPTPLDEFEYEDGLNDQPLESFGTAEELNQFNEIIDSTDEENIAPIPTIDFDDIQDSLSDLDFSEFAGKKPFRHYLKTLDKTLKKQSKKKVVQHQEIGVKKHATIFGKKERKISNIIVPNDRKVIIEGVSKFMLDNSAKATATKNIGYYQGKKLKELVLTFNNTGATTFEIELFNPSAPLDFLHSTSQNLNDKILVAGNSPVSYSDVLFNLLANPALIVNAKFICAGPLLNQQVGESLFFKNKSIEGKQKVNPYNMFLQKDVDQFQNTIIYFDVMGVLNRPFIPDGMDVIAYKIYPGNSVTMAFYYKQVSLKKFFYKEALNSKGLF